MIREERKKRNEADDGADLRAHLIGVIEELPVRASRAQGRGSDTYEERDLRR